MEPYTILSILASSIILFTFWAVSNAKAPKNLPPGPPKLPLIGHIHLLEKLAPHRRLRDLSRKYGPIMHLQLGHVSTVVVSTPRLAEEILKARDLSFAHRPKGVTSEIFFYKATNIAWADYGNYWRQVKKVTMLELLSAKKVKSYFHIRVEELANTCRYLDSRSGTPIHLRDMTAKMVNNIVSRAAIGDVCEDRETLVDCALRVLNTFNAFNLFNYYPSLSFMNVVTGKEAEWMRMHKQLDSILRRIVDEHRRKPGGSQDQEDMVDFLLRVQQTGDLDVPLTDDNIKALILEVLTAGTSSTSTTIEWAFCEMLRNPEILKKAQAEVRSVVKGNKVTLADIENMHYLKLVVKETFRLHGVPILLPRINPEDCTVDGYHIPANTRILINSFACATDPDTWDNPDSFIPDRFKNSPITFTGTDYEFLPFGAGRRMCPGLNFGLGSIEYSLSTLLLNYDWKLPEGMKPGDIEMREYIGISTLPIKPLYVVPISVSKPN